MKLPAPWIAAAFATGITTSWRLASAPHVWIAAATATLLVAGILVWRARAALAWTFTLLAWLALGGLALSIERAAVPAHHVTRMIAAGRIDTSVPLRWRGRLREDPTLLPWGHHYEIALEQVESAGDLLRVSGGLRVNLYAGPNAEGVPDGLRAGDRVEALLTARPPRSFLDPGAFDRRGFLARQKNDLTGTLRSGELLRLIDSPPPGFLHRLARARGNLLARLDALFVGQPDRRPVLRAMILGDRNLIESDVATTFQKTSAYHVLVVAGLHVGALAVFLIWLCRRLRLPAGVTFFVIIAALAAFTGLVQDRPPILRAAMMAALYLCARPLFRRVEFVNTVALAALALLLWKPASLTASSFQLSFLAAGVIAGLAIPWMDRTSAPYRAGLAHLADVTHDGAHLPKIARFRIEMRALSNWLASRLPPMLAPRSDMLLSLPIRAGLRLWEIALFSGTMQLGMTPLMALDFHRIGLAGPLSNIPAVMLTGLIVPLGFLTLALTFVWTRLALLFAHALGLCAGWLLATVNWFGRLPRVAYRVPGPPVWLLIAFFAALVCLAAARAAAARRTHRFARRLPAPRIHPAEWVAAVALAAFAIMIGIYPIAPSLARGKLEVSVLDVGQGDSIFLAFPGGRTMLIDGGGQAGSEWIGGYYSGIDIGEEVVSPYLWSRGVKRLDVIAVTHAHHDHIDGLHSVLQNFHVHELWVGRDEETPAFESLLAEARSLGVAIVHRESGSKFNWDGVAGEILWPEDPTPVQEASNDDSLVMRLSDNQVRFMLPGDIQEHVEEKLAGESAPFASAFLKAPHHGSKTSSTDAFLDAVAPRVAVISVGETNPFGHPSDTVIERYQERGIRLLRTDRDGAVTALTEGQTLTEHTFAEEHPQQ